MVAAEGGVRKWPKLGGLGAWSPRKFCAPRCFFIHSEDRFTLQHETALGAQEASAC